MNKFILVIGISISMSARALFGGFAIEEKIDFDKQIRPILSDRCFACHGPDEADRQADLRLDEREAALRESEYGERPFVIKPGEPSESELLLRMITDDEDLKMPPPESHLKVTDEEIRLIENWIRQGAEWTEHWAFQSVKSNDVPKTDDQWPANFIDQFVLEKLRAENLKPNPVADHEVLARRVYLDLTGLPPTVEQLDDFLADPSDTAYENLVDKLLAQKAYGERMAVEWLDVARYADTYGYQT
ncbi:MAG: DUF1549 domain-containing protein, partial [Planctomycetota bacterium]